MPALVVASSRSFGDGVVAWTDGVLMILDPGRMCGMAFSHSQNIAWRFVRITAVALLRGDVLDATRLRHLVRRVVDEHVDPAELGHRDVHDMLARRLVP
jgi:hypothetical protein